MLGKRYKCTNVYVQAKPSGAEGIEEGTGIVLSDPQVQGPVVEEADDLTPAPTEPQEEPVVG